MIKPFVNMLRKDQIQFSCQVSERNTKITIVLNFKKKHSEKKKEEDGYYNTKLEETPGK
jgi:hypothetical protein